MTGPQSVIDMLVLNGCVVEPCGSRITCVPAPTDTDQDYLVQVSGAGDPVSKAVDILSAAGFLWEGNEHYQDAASTFMSWRHADVNFIVTADARFAERHRLATRLCKQFNLLQKTDRIALFQAVLYGEPWNGIGQAPATPAHQAVDEMGMPF